VSVDKGIGLTSANKNGWTALHALVCNYNGKIPNFLDAVRQLLNAWVPLNAVAAGIVCWSCVSIIVATASCQRRSSVD